MKEALEEAELQHPGEDNDTALGHGPPVDVVVVGLQEEGVSPFPHPGKVVEAPHVEGVHLQLLDAGLQERQSYAQSCPWGSVLHSVLQLSPSKGPAQCPGQDMPITALLGHPDPHPNCLQGVVQLLPLCWLLVLHVEVIIVHTKVEIHLH